MRDIWLQQVLQEMDLSIVWLVSFHIFKFPLIGFSWVLELSHPWISIWCPITSIYKVYISILQIRENYINSFLFHNKGSSFQTSAFRMIVNIFSFPNWISSWRKSAKIIWLMASEQTQSIPMQKQHWGSDEKCTMLSELIKCQMFNWWYLTRWRTMIKIYDSTCLTQFYRSILTNYKKKYLMWITISLEIVLYQQKYQWYVELT